MRRLLILAAAGGLALSAPAMAGPYLGAGIGGVRVESTLAKLGLPPNVAADVEYLGAGDFSSTDVGFQILAGWRFGSYFGVEVGYGDLGEARKFYELEQLCDGLGCQPREWRAIFKTDVVQAFLTGYYPLGEMVEVYGKAGVVFWDTDFRGEEVNKLLSPSEPPIVGPRNDRVLFSDDGTDLAVAIGLNLKMDSPFSIRTEFAWYDIDNTDQFWQLSLLAIYNF